MIAIRVACDERGAWRSGEGLGHPLFVNKCGVGICDAAEHGEEIESLVADKERLFHVA